jgi:hypothetical protein
LKKGGLLWAIEEPLTVGQHLVMCEEKCLPAVVVRRIIELIFFILPHALVFVINPIANYVYVS